MNLPKPLGGFAGEETDDESPEDGKERSKPKSVEEASNQQEETVIIGLNGLPAKIKTTVSSHIKLDFNNTRIIRDGKVIDPNDTSSASSIMDINRIKQCV